MRIHDETVRPHIGTLLRKHASFKLQNNEKF